MGAESVCFLYLSLSQFIIRDSYTSLKIIRRKYLQQKIQAINDKKRMSAADVAALKKLKEELVPIEKFLNEAKQQRDAIAAEVASLQFDTTKCVIIVDFTKWGLVVDGNVHCFVMCVLFGEPKLPGSQFSLSNYFIIYLVYVEFYFSDERIWKPTIKYYDFFAQSTEQKKVKQVFPFVKVCLVC